MEGQQVVSKAIGVSKTAVKEGLEFAIPLIAYELLRTRGVDIAREISERTGFSYDISEFLAGVGIATAGYFMKQSFIVKLGMAVSTMAFVRKATAVGFQIVGNAVNTNVKM